MKKLYGIIFILISLQNNFSQEIKATVQVNAAGVATTNKQIFTTLQNAIQTFVNNRKWTDDQFATTEKIELNLFFEISKMDGENMTASLNVQSIRPVFGSNYKTQLINFKDEEVYFMYKEFQNLEYQDNASVNDLTSIVAYYIYIVLGLDYDSFTESAGTNFYSKAQNLLNLNSSNLGWRQNDGKGNRNRYYLIENLINSRFAPFRKLNYEYHRKGMDHMYEDQTASRSAILAALGGIKDLISLMPNTMWQRTWFSTKLNELVEIFKGGTAAEKENAVQLLTKLDPADRQKWEKIKE